MKYRYSLRNKHTQEIHYKWYTISQIETAGLKHLFDIENYDIISRNAFTGLTDSNNEDIYSGDELICETTKKDMNGKEENLLTVEHVNHLTYHGYRLYGKDRRFNIKISNSTLFNLKAKLTGKNIHDKN